MHEVTRILNAIDQGDPKAAEGLLPLVYEELRKLASQKIAQEKPGQTLQATALVHEAYVRLVDRKKDVHPWNSRGHFFGAAHFSGTVNCLSKFSSVSPVGVQRWALMRADLPPVQTLWFVDQCHALMS